ncbi:MAG: ATP-binding protein [Clostridia bacterium]
MMFSDIIGNDKLKKELIHSVEINKTSHSYLFIGTEGIGKKLIAEEFAKMLLAVKDTENSPDFSIIEPDGNSIKIEQIREFQKKVSEKPIISNKKVYIINDSDKMTVEAQNCLLKTLEEPPEFVTIILIGSNENSFLSTIKSRCMILHFEKISDEQIQKYLQDNHQTEINSKIMLEACQGSIGKALEIKDKQELYQNTEQVVNSLERKDKIDILNMSDFIYKSKDDKLEILNYMNVLFINLAKINSKYADCIAIVEETKRRLQTNANYDMCIDNLLLSLWENVNY